MKRFLPYSFLLLLVSFFCSLAQAQAPVYTLKLKHAAYTPLTSGTTLGTTFNDDVAFIDEINGTRTGPGFPIGFPFTYNGETFDRFAVSTNGWILLGTGTFYYNQTYSILAETGIAGYAYAIAGLSTDLQAQDGASIQYNTIGTAPNRILVVQWLNYRKYGGVGDNFNFQIRLHETTNIIELSYGTMLNDAATATAQVGLRGANVDDVKAITSTSDWEAATYTTSPDATMPLSATTMPPAGFSITWVPGSPLPVRWLSFTAKQREEVIDLLWHTANERNNRQFVLQRSKEGRVFHTFDTIAAAGNGITSHTYTAFDQQPYAGTSFYRIQQVDMDGSVHYSPVIRITNAAINNEGFTIAPASHAGYFRLRSANSHTAKTITVQVSNPAGITILRKEWVLTAGIAELPLDLSPHPAGLYVVHLSDQTGQQLQVLKVVKH